MKLSKVTVKKVGEMKSGEKETPDKNPKIPILPILSKKSYFLSFFNFYFRATLGVKIVKEFDFDFFNYF